MNAGGVWPGPRTGKCDICYFVMGSERIIRLLLVEDERKLAQSIQRKLEHHGYRVKICLDGVSAEKQMKGSSYDLIILDLTLPLKSGLDVLKDFRNSGKTTPVLILSARDTTKDRILGLDLGADDYMVKPFDSGELVARIESLLRRAGASNEYVLKAADLVMDVGKRTVEPAPSSRRTGAGAPDRSPDRPARAPRTR